ncbi:conserved hypothetical protein [Desulfamplus magnetovallimortis]|uniref:Uncharacterized protein n=1 Tax=Desulfamplus magnetovallimortis TaxID=1246637 RepID=A0A1W1H8U5_9BACT|nr:DUF6516 family protein [Desulfamplus magnetovallimortis]SLM28815.1 conserved hypothetical protein [Desulfamplus magnetovallimortis]
MINQLRTPDDYELFIYTISEIFPSVRHSTLTFVRKGSFLARVAGEVWFDNNIRIVVRERLVYTRLPVVIDWYGYEVWKGEEKLYWYDSQPHPNDLTLQSTYPHHKHIPPNIKHNRIPAPDIFFTKPNIPSLIREVEKII